jgi:hypothetical protein
MNRFVLSEKHVKSYATEANLDKALVKLGIDKLRHLLFRTDKGRYTAVFALPAGGGFPLPLHHGFTVFG